MTVAVVVNTFDRPQCLDRLLRSLDSCDARHGTELVISIDGGGTHRNDTLAIARNFRWRHGPLKVMERADLGLVDHFRACGDLVDELGAIVVLEDDLIVGPNALRFAAMALDFTSNDDRIEGVSLSLPWFDGFRHLPFEPLLDGSAAVYAKLPWFHGMAWTPEQWRRHRVGADADASTPLPAAFAELGDDEWFPDAVRSLLACDGWYLLSRDAHAVNFGDAGVHFDEATLMFQRPIARGVFVPPLLLGLDDADVVPYDEYLEADPRWLSRHVDAMAGLDVTLDLRGVRDPEMIDTEWVISSRPTLRAERQWGSVMRPLEQNLISDVPGDTLSLCRTKDLVVGRAGDRVAEQSVVEHAYRGRPPGVRAAMRRRAISALVRRGRAR